MRNAFVIAIAIIALGFAGKTYFFSSVNAEPAKESKPDKDGHDHGAEGHKDDEESEEGHDHKEGEAHEEEGDDHAHGEEEGEDGHAHGEGEKDEHGEEGEEGGVIGPDKGITAKGKNGFTLSKEAWASFELKTQQMEEGASIPNSAVVHIKAGKYYYRIRDGWIKRVPLTERLKKGDQIITSGMGFVRTAELVTEEGVSHGHSH